MSKRIHNTNSEQIALHNMHYQQKVDFKPRGIWYDLNGEWLDWCSTEMPHYIKKNDFELKLDFKKMLLLRTEDAVRDFAACYQVQLNPDFSSLRNIDWPRVAQEYAGIEIAPYQYSLRFARDFLWYYGWDCASGCVWSADAIREIVPIGSLSLEVEL